MKSIMVAVIVLGVLLDLLSWKYRQYASYIVYFEMIYGILFSLAPVNLGEISEPFYVMNIGMLYGLFAC